MPTELLDQWRKELDWKDGIDVSDRRAVELRQRIAKYEDAGHGECWLRDPRIAELVENALLHFDGQRYRLIAWCIMPNHVHVLMETWDRWPLAGILHSWKSYTAKEASKTLNRRGAFWFREYHDRFIRNERHYTAAVEYIEQNPVKAGLATSAADWRFSSASAAKQRHAGKDAGAPRRLPQTFSRTLAHHGLSLRRNRTEILQINTGKLCNLTCVHCHVNAGPKRREIMTRETIDRILTWLAGTGIHTVDLTGGAPEMIPDFRYLVERLREMPQIETIIDRCNLTILLEPGYEWLADFLAANRVNIVASMPCYEPANVNAQRGEGVFDASIRALQLLNRHGYGRLNGLPLDLVYNPNGAFLPPDQAALEADYKRELKAHFGIGFHRLYTITNMPIARFASWLRHSGKLDAYMQVLAEAFNPASVAGLMCRNTLSVGWRGEVHDCDFNQQLGMQWKNSDASRAGGKPLFLWDINAAGIKERPIAVGDHCFGCTAGHGSSCGGALL